MSETISRGRMFRVSVAVNDATVKALKNAPAIASKSVQAGADYWHSKVLPGHFDAGAGAKYGYAFRSKNYRKQKRGKPDLVFSGSMRRDLTSRAAYIEEAKGAIALKMFARVLNFAPSMPQNSDDAYVTHKSRKGASRSYPNTKREVKVVLPAEREAIADVVTDTAADLFTNHP